MGGSVSSGKNNDDLIDNLLEADYIKTPSIERVFRAVDRAEYFLPEARGTAYKDLAWKSGNLHISAPCIYSEVMEGLDLTPGVSFLNLGSGTGYLSTMVGLILGTHGVNHGVEIHEDVIEYAIRKLEDFKKHSGAIDEYDFCEPKFIQGNCLCLSTECSKLYDRIYCGAACPEQFEPYMKNLLKIGGILVMPLNDQLLQIKRLSDNQWKIRTLLPVSFASLIMPPDGCQDFIKPIDIEPLSLQVLCRSVVRNILRKNVEREHPPVRKTAPKAPKKKRTLRRMAVPLIEEAMDSSDDEHQVLRLGGERNRDAGRAVFRREEDGIFRFLLGMGVSHRGSGDRTRANDGDNNTATWSRSAPMETDEAPDRDNVNNRETNEHQVQAVIEYHPDNDEEEEEDRHNQDGDMDVHDNNDSDYQSEVDRVRGALVDCLDLFTHAVSEHLEESEAGLQGNGANSENPVNNNRDNVEGNSHGGSHDGQGSESANSDGEAEAPDPKPSTSNSTPKRSGKREKFDSGLGDEIIETQNSSDEENTRLDTISSCDEDYSSEKRYKRGTKTCAKTGKFRRIGESGDRRRWSDSSSDSEEDELKVVTDDMRMYQSPYTEYLRVKIQQLPLPPILKKYLNYYRDFKKPHED